MSKRPRVFVSYVRDNLAVVVRLVAHLRKLGADVWFDRDALPPGTVWRDEIRQAISRHEFFLACFSQEQNVRSRTYMNEELELAIEEIRLRGNVPWFIPIRLSGEIPDIRIGANRSLRDIQYVDLDDANWSSAIRTIASAMGLAPTNTDSPTPEPLATITFTPPDDVELHLRNQPVRHMSWLATVVAAAVTVAILGFAIPRLTDRPQPRINVDSAPLQPDGMRGPENAPLQIAPRPDEKDFLLVPVLPRYDSATGDHRTYRLDIVHLGGASPRVIWTREGLVPRRDGTFPVLVPGAFFTAGTYQLRIYQRDDRATTELARYTMSVTRGN